MNIPSLYGDRAFYDSTSALNGVPFANPRTCGVMGTMRDNTLGANLASCGLGAYPDYGNIGYANRIYSTNGFFDDFLGGAKQVGQNVLGFIAPTVGAAVETLIGTAMKKTREAVCYKFLEVVQVPYKGAMAFGSKAQKPDGSFVVVMPDGVELPFTGDIARAAQQINPQTGMPVAAVAGIAVGAVALIALFLFMRRR